MTLSRLLVWFSPAFPIGAFSFSHGLEWAVEAGDVQDRASLEEWLGTLISMGSGWSDAVLLAQAHRAATAKDERLLAEAAALAIALQPSRERRLEAAMQGDAFVRSVETAWANAGLALLRAAAPAPHALSVAAGAATAGEGFPLQESVQAYLTGFCQNLVSSAVRLAPSGRATACACWPRWSPASRPPPRARRGRSSETSGGLRCAPISRP